MLSPEYTREEQEDGKGLRAWLCNRMRGWSEASVGGLQTQWSPSTVKLLCRVQRVGPECVSTARADKCTRSLEVLIHGLSRKQKGSGEFMERGECGTERCRMKRKSDRMLQVDRISICVPQVGEYRVLQFVNFPVGGKAVTLSDLVCRPMSSTARSGSMNRGLHYTVACTMKYKASISLLAAI